MTVIVDTRADFTLENFRRVGLGGESVRVGPRAVERMEATRASFVALLNSDRTAFIYGTTTRPGIEVGRALAPDEQRGYAGTLRGSWSPSFGGGGVLEEHVARGIVFARLANFVEGNAKTRPVIAERIAALLDGPLPELPLGGHVAAGEILTLAPLMNAIEGDFEEGETMALVNGSPCAAALAADVALAARHRLHGAERVFALSIEAFGAPLDAYDEALEAFWEDENEIAALQGLRGYLEGALETDRLDHQAPVSYRILPRVLGQAHRAVGAIEHAATVSLRSVTDNPVYVPPDERHPLGRAISTGGYHNGMVYPAMSALAGAWADVVFLAERHVTAMHVGATSELPPLLERPGGGGGKTNLLGWVAGSFLEDARTAASATLLPSGIGDAQNDVGVPTFLAYRKERVAADCLDSALALLAASSSQALWATDRAPAPPLRPLLDRVRSVFEPVDDPAGRRIGDELGRLAQEFAAAARTGAGGLA
ncbi:MAG: aromatic amino acid lyase [Gaiellaceae bacterium]|jgi:histidine ammonia-lyase